MLCVIAKLSDGATEHLRALREAAAVRGRALPPLHGHITLASWLPEEDAGFIGACADIARANRLLYATAFLGVAVSLLLCSAIWLGAVGGGAPW